MRMAISIALGFLGLGALGAGLAMWIDLGCGLAAVGLAVILLVLRSSPG